MDLNNNFGKAEDRISKLPESVLHHILSFLDDDMKVVVRTCVLSKRWRHIWTSTPTLKFPIWNLNNPPSVPQTDTFKNFVDMTLLRRDANIRETEFYTHKHFLGASSRVHLWIQQIVEHQIEKVTLSLDLNEPFYLPLSLFKCQSLIELKLDLHVAETTAQLPKIFSFPNLKILRLCQIRFTDDGSWNEQKFSSCPVLEELEVAHCTWFGVRNFCISTPTLKRLYIRTRAKSGGDDGLQNCALEINTPNLVEFIYSGNVAKEYALSIFQKLKYASVDLFCESGVLREQEQQTGYGAATANFFLALSHVENLTLFCEILETMSIIDDSANILPTFHDLKELMLSPGKTTTDKSLFSLLKSAPHVTLLAFEECIDNYEENKNDWAAHMSTAGCLLQHLKEVSFVEFSGNARQMRWVEFVLKNAKTLESMTLFTDDVKNKEGIISKLQGLPRASDRCKIEFGQ